MLIFMAITYFIVGMGVNNGLEKANFIMMPALIVVAAILAVYALTMPGAIDGLAFYLVPDFSKFSPELVIAALGQTFFTLSLAMGIMVTYGSYLDKATKLTSSVAQIAGSTFGVSLLAGFMIIPATFAAMGSGEAVAENSAPPLCSSFCLRYLRVWQLRSRCGCWLLRPGFVRRSYQRPFFSGNLHFHCPGCNPLFSR